jgi:UDP:flavonoid glycosyltransferase YjiC (YdhE family)
VASFLARHPSPLVFTPGTGIGEPQPFFEAAADCCAELQRPGVLLSPFLSHPPSRSGVELAHFGHVELQALLPHCSAIVHHGGLGTTARALQAGIVQVISPVGFDQPDNGHRVEVLGVGGVVPRLELSGARLAQALRALEASPGIEARLEAYRAALVRPRAVERAASLVEKVPGLRRGLGGTPAARARPHSEDRKG